MTTSNQKKERSRAYPAMPLDEALSRIESINENLGLNGQFNRESIAVGMGYKSLNGASIRRVAALVHYGFLSRDKDQYSLSPLAKQYLIPVNDNDRDVALREAALSPALFEEIYAAFKGQVIPRQFQNRLIQEFGIQQKAAPEVERIFKSTMETARILQTNGILNSEATPVATQSNTDTPDTNGSNASTANPTVQQNANSQNSTPAGYLSVNLPSGLIVSYSQDLASAFAFGAFGTQLKALDEAVAKHATPSPATNDSDNDEEV